MLMEEKHFEWRRGALWIWGVPKCDFRWWGPFLYHRKIESNFSTSTNMSIWAVFTKKYSTNKNWDLSLFWHFLTALAGFCMISSYVRMCTFESKGITQIDDGGDKFIKLLRMKLRNEWLKERRIKTQFKFTMKSYCLLEWWLILSYK